MKEGADTEIECSDFEGGDPREGTLRGCLEAMHDQLTPTTECKLVEGLRRLQLKTGGVLDRASACSGCDVQRFVVQELVRIWASRYDIKFKVVDSFMCDKARDRQQFLMSQVAGHREVLFADLAHLQHSEAYDLISLTTMLLPCF